MKRASSVLNNTRKIIDFLKTREASQAPSVLPEFNLTHFIWYAGALIIMGAMEVFTTEAFNRMGGWALTAAGGGLRHRPHNRLKNHRSSRCFSR